MLALGAALVRAGTAAKRIVERCVHPAVFSGLVLVLAGALAGWPAGGWRLAGWGVLTGVVAGFTASREAGRFLRVLIALLFSGLAAALIGQQRLSPLQTGLPVVTAAAGVLYFARPRRPKRAFGILPALRRYELHVLRYHFPAETIRANLRGGETARVLDVGCGRGQLKAFLPDHVEMHGLDISEDRVRRSRAAGYLTLQHDLETGVLPYPDNTFDAVVFCHCLEHVRRFDDVLSEAERVVKPGGLVIVGIPNKIPGMDRLQRISAAFRRRRAGETCNVFTTAQLLERIRGACPGMELEDLRGFRLFSARKVLPLEDYHWFYRVSAWFGRRFPAFCPEVNVTMRKPCAVSVPVPAGSHGEDHGGAGE